MKTQHDPNVTFTSILLSNIREEAKQAGVEVPKGLTTMRPAVGGTNPYYEVWADNCLGLVWQGNAYNASDAKAKYISELIEAATT